MEGEEGVEEVKIGLDGAVGRDLDGVTYDALDSGEDGTNSGDPLRGACCIMSMVGVLAEERFGDSKLLKEDAVRTVLHSLASEAGEFLPPVVGGRTHGGERE
jgi:hypothetical protein